MAVAKKTVERETAKRGRGRPLAPVVSAHQVIHEALAIIDGEGLDALSMRRLAKQLGVNAPTLYHYFANKEAILIAVARQAIATMPTQRPTGATGVDYFVRVMQEYRRMLLAHPNLVALMAHLRLESLISDATYEHGAGALAESGVPPELLLTLTEAGEALVFGWVFSKQADRDLSHVNADGPARRELAKANSLDEERRFELACYSLANGFLATVMLRGPQSWVGANGRPKQASSRRQRS